MKESPSRREALKRIGATAAVAVGAGALATLRWDRHGQAREASSQRHAIKDFRVPPRTDLPTMAVAKRGTDPNSLTRAAIDALGGMSRFVAKGDVVTIKPNVGWDRSPMHAANTNPEVVASVVRACYEAGAKHVIVTDYSCNEVQRSFQRSGIWKAAYEAGAEVLLPAEHQFRTVAVGGTVLGEWPVLRPIIDADKVINVPIAKHHSLARFTGCMKNWYGLIGGRRNRLHQDINTSIADLAAFIRPTLTIIDAVRVLVRNGPQGGNIDDTREMNTVIATLDEIAGDTYACELIGENPERVGYLRLGQQRGIGTMNLKQVQIREV
ncbi:MAG TPA: DUF362 domain-containing protein [Polyangiaceae bacterium]|nr:DUF362 domain-containing protein [Polyangiaceae bacterium]HNZ25053.1 DUF362 domain-containing protein [Polyangiaceae bacterium]HOD24407.1 DUF362 domain-containing protein [Polyangiaceae bacterium]HOE49951.1 DUF362 domain-containing protein [Polyangiaceae bacterium]HOH03146.1 DUF362 domain-containing protein [Polyangiaceae bacterium]